MKSNNNIAGMIDIVIVGICMFVLLCVVDDVVDDNPPPMELEE